MVDAAALVVTVIVKEKNRLIRNVPEMIAVNVIMIVIETGVVLEIVTATIAIETGIEITEKEIEVVIAKKLAQLLKKITSVEIEEIENVTVTEDIVGIVIKMVAIMINVITVVVVVTVIVIVDAEIIENEGMIFKVDEVEEEYVVEAVVEDLIEVDQDKFHGAEFPHEEEEDQDFHHMDNTNHHICPNAPKFQISTMYKRFPI